MEIIEPILYIAISQTFFAGLIVASKKPPTVPDRLIAAFLFMLFFDLLFALVKINFITFYSFPFIAFTYGPLLFLYVKYMTGVSEKFGPVNFLHFIPFVIFFIISVIFRDDKVFTDLTGFLVADRYISLRIVYGVCFFLSITVYSVYTFVIISRHQKHLKDLVSYSAGKITLNWLKIISISFYAAYFVLFILGGINIFIDFLPFDPYYTIFVFIALFAFIYGFYAIKQPVLSTMLIGKEEFTYPRRQKEEAREPKTKYIRSGLSDEKAGAYLKRIIRHMEDKKPYLDRDLTIYDLAGQTGISRHHITQVLNDKYDRNFFTFINEYRVNEVIRRMKDPANKNFTVLAIAYDSGFNSKSTFNTIFKKITHHTPSQYLNNLDKKGS